MRCDPLFSIRALARQVKEKKKEGKVLRENIQRIQMERGALEPPRGCGNLPPSARNIAS